MTVWIYRLPALSDNYIFLLHDLESQTAAVVDPAEPEPVLAQLKKLGATLTTILNTHHHGDHVGANRALQTHYPDLQIYGGAGDRDRIPGQQFFLKAGASVSFGGYTAQVLFVPGHTRAHIAYYVPPLDADQALPEVFPSLTNPLQLGLVGDLFCGDTLFAGGCGRLFEGTPQQMLDSLSQIRSLPASTRIWCAHEYTLNNLRFAVTVEANNAQLQHRLEQVQQARQHGTATVPSVLQLEQQTNPFLRWDQPALQATVAASEPIKTFARLRSRKDLF